MVFLSIFAERFHQSLRDWKESEKLCVVVFCILLLLLLDRSGRLSRASSRNEDVFPNENLELIIIIEVEEEEGTTLREEHRRRRRLLEKEEELVAEVVA
jgi:hypothetical protein|tara:strand:+ start:213 stop:509 length:297 start_codon:yes stop_codon:yes gene_type:complete